MSRTWRNRHAVPKGYKMREGCDWAIYDSEGRECYFDSDSRTEIVWRYPFVFNSYWGNTIIEPTVLENWKLETFSRKERIPMELVYVKKFRKSYTSKESKIYRKIDRGRKRASVRDKLKTGQWDDIPSKETKTCGWNTW